jgi:hypothetical protein
MAYWMFAITVVLIVVEEIGQASDRKKRDR